jgi:hypothetical protein
MPSSRGWRFSIARASLLLAACTLLADFFRDLRETDLKVVFLGMASVWQRAGQGARGGNLKLYHYPMLLGTCPAGAGVISISPLRNDFEKRTDAMGRTLI